MININDAVFTILHELLSLDGQVTWVVQKGEAYNDPLMRWISIGCKTSNEPLLGAWLRVDWERIPPGLIHWLALNLPGRMVELSVATNTPEERVRWTFGENETTFEFDTP